MTASPFLWPDLPWAEWQDTADTLHLWTQIVGKTRLALTPLQNHWWNVPLYVTARGLTTSAMPIPPAAGAASDLQSDLLDIEFDFDFHRLHLRLASGPAESIPLETQTVADFYAAYTYALARLGLVIPIYPMPVEIADPIRFDLDTTHATYDPDAAHRFWQALAHAQTVFQRFNSSFLGKVSPIHFFWGSFDLAVTRFSGRPAPARPPTADAAMDRIQAEAYSHEAISAGFWPGNGGYGAAAFYCYAAPVPEGIPQATIPGPGAYDPKLGEFILRYADARNAPDPAACVLEFLESSYAAAANAAHWDRAALERSAPASMRQSP
jgi:hypothetical protein